MADENNTDATAQAGDIAPAPVAETPAPVAEPPAPVAAVKALIAAGGVVPKKETRLVIVSEIRADDGSDAQGAAYGAGAAYAFRMTPDLDMGYPDEKTMTLGRNIAQFAFSGFAPTPIAVNVGPGHPAFAAANFAYNLGAREIEVSGLSDHWKERLQPYFDEVNAAPDFGVTIILT